MTTFVIQNEDWENNEVLLVNIFVILDMKSLHLVMTWEREPEKKTESENPGFIVEYQEGKNP